MRLQFSIKDYAIAVVFVAVVIALYKMSIFAMQFYEPP